MSLILGESLEFKSCSSVYLSLSHRNGHKVDGCCRIHLFQQQNDCRDSLNSNGNCIHVYTDGVLDRGYIKSLSPYQSNLMSFREDATSSTEAGAFFLVFARSRSPFLHRLFLCHLPTSRATFAATLSRCIRVLPS